MMSLTALAILIFHLYYVGSLYARYNVAVKINVSVGKETKMIFCLHSVLEFEFGFCVV